MEFRQIKYPYDINCDKENNWFSFGHNTGSVSIPDAEIEEWINKVIKDIKGQIENGDKNPYSLVASGDTIVFGFFCQDNCDDVWNVDNYFNIIVAKNYEEGSFFISDIQKQLEDGKEEKFNDFKRLFIQDLDDDPNVNLELGKELKRLSKDYNIYIRKKEED